MNIRRYYFPNQIVFLTQIVNGRKPIFNNPIAFALLRETLRNVKELYPFVMVAYVFLPDHFHLLIRPKPDNNFSQIMYSLKTNFTKEYKQKLHYHGNLHFWQKRFWDHIIRDETDLENHINYIHYNPVKHGYVKNVEIWKDISYFEWRNRGLYNNSADWLEPSDLVWGE